jgi:hypothetical protein
MTHPLRSWYLQSRLCAREEDSDDCFEDMPSEGDIIADASEELGASIAGEATAIGEDTDVDVDVSVEHRDFGPMSIIRGSASFEAKAEGDEDSPPTVFADAIAEVFGVDVLYIERTQSESGFQAVDGTLVATRKTTLDFLAVEFENFDYFRGPLVTSTSNTEAAPVLTDVADGNAAEFAVEANGTGDNVHPATDVSVLTTEDQLSSVAAYADLLIG